MVPQDFLKFYLSKEGKRREEKNMMPMSQLS